MEQFFFEIALVLAFTSAVSLVAYFLKQPLILAYMGAGLLIGPSGLGLIHEFELLHSLADIGILLLLFLVGLEMNPEKIRSLGFRAFFVGVGQILITGSLSAVFLSLLGLTGLALIYLTIALTLSSTVIAVKLLNDKNDSSSLYGQVAISILLVQDLLAVMALLFFSGLSEGSFDWLGFGETFLFGGLILAAIIILATKFIRFLYNRIAKSTELLILFSLGWAFFIALLADKLGFNIEIGAFLAGISLAALPYSFEIRSKTKVLRDFFITLFFVALGATVSFTDLSEVLLASILISIFVLVIKPLVVHFLMQLLGYEKRSSLFTALSLSNVSEFSLILLALGLSLGHVNSKVLSLVALIAMITMAFSSYLMTYNKRLYNWLRPKVPFLFLRHKKPLNFETDSLENHFIIVGCGRTGQQVVDMLSNQEKPYIAIDHDSFITQKLTKIGLDVVFGDAEDNELLPDLNINKAEMLISTIPNAEVNLFLIKKIQALPPQDRPVVIMLADSSQIGLELFNAGADYIILKPYLSARYIKDITEELYNFKPLKRVSSLQGTNGEKDYEKMLHQLGELRLKEISQSRD